MRVRVRVRMRHRDTVPQKKRERKRVRLRDRRRNREKCDGQRRIERKEEVGNRYHTRFGRQRQAEFDHIQSSIKKFAFFSLLPSGQS